MAKLGSTVKAIGPYAALAVVLVYAHYFVRPLLNPAPGPAPAVVTISPQTTAAIANWRKTEGASYAALKGRVTKLSDFRATLKSQMTPAAQAVTDGINADLKRCTLADGETLNGPAFDSLMDQISKAFGAAK